MFSYFQLSESIAAREGRNRAENDHLFSRKKKGALAPEATVMSACWLTFVGLHVSPQSAHDDAGRSRDEAGEGSSVA